MERRKRKYPMLTDPEFIPYLRNLLKNGKYADYMYGVNCLIAGAPGVLRRIRTKEEFQQLKQVTRRIDVSILTHLSNEPQTTVNNLLLHTKPTVFVVLRLEVMNHYNLVKYDQDSGTVEIGEEFGAIDVLTLPIHADQIPLSPREKLAYLLIRLSEETGGCRTYGELYELATRYGYTSGYYSLWTGGRLLQILGVIDKSKEKFGYSALVTVEDVFVYEDIETLIEICKCVGKRGKKDENR